MNRNGGVVALTVVGVLVASGAAAAVNTRILHGGTNASVGSAEDLLSSTDGSGVATSRSPSPGSASQSALPARTEQPSRSSAPAARSSTPPSGGDGDGDPDD